MTGSGQQAATRQAGLAVGELAERFVPDAGLDGHGERQITVGETVARVSVGDGLRVRTEWLKTTDRSDQKPADADAVRQVRAVVKEVKAALAGERGRLEALLTEERSWAVADWRVMLLFDGDQVLSIVLSKAVLLAADDKITDPAITSQLRARRRGPGTGRSRR